MGVGWGETKEPKSPGKLIHGLFVFWGLAPRETNN